MTEPAASAKFRYDLLPKIHERNPKTDILDDLKELINRRPGTADSDVNVFSIELPIRWGIVEKAIAEIEKLRKQIKDTTDDRYG